MNVCFILIVSVQHRKLLNSVGLYVTSRIKEKYACDAIEFTLCLHYSVVPTDTQNLPMHLCYTCAKVSRFRSHAGMVYYIIIYMQKLCLIYL